MNHSLIKVSTIDYKLILTSLPKTKLLIVIILWSVANKLYNYNLACLYFLKLHLSTIVLICYKFPNNMVHSIINFI